MRDALVSTLLYGVFPLWLLSGLTDWWCHRRADISQTSGWRESALHIAMIAELGIGVLLAVLLQINAMVLALLLILGVLHQLTAVWDSAYAAPRRHISVLEQHVHSFLELLPWVAILLVALLHLDQMKALIGMSDTPADFSFRMKQPPLESEIVFIVISAGGLLAVLPFLEEFRRGRRRLMTDH